MITSKAYTKYIRVSPRKLRQVIDLIRGEKANQALLILVASKKRASTYAQKTLKSAISNARQNPAVTEDELFISKITADKGPMLKRYRAAAMGRATMIRHRTSHLKVELSKIKSAQKLVKTPPSKRIGGPIPVDKTPKETAQKMRRPKQSRKAPQKRRVRR